MGFLSFFIFYGILKNQAKILEFGFKMQVKMQVKNFTCFFFYNVPYPLTQKILSCEL